MKTNKETSKSIAEGLKRARKMRGLTQSDLAVLMYEASNGQCDYSDDAISTWERGRSVPSGYAMLVACEVLGIDAKDLTSQEYAFVNVSPHEMTNAPDTRLERIEEIYAELNEEGRKSLLKSAEMHYSFIEFKE